MIREPAVSGQFYPADVNELQSLIESFAKQKKSKISAKGMMLPHAGYIYSGKVAILTAASVIAKRKVIILGPNHTGFGESFSIFAKGKWRMPFGDVPIDTDIASRILGAGKKIKDDYLAHMYEHSIEVQLPILHYLFGDFTFVPIACSLASIDIYQSIAQQIYEAIKPDAENVLLVASSDMSHYEEDSLARKKDRSALGSILNLDENELVKRVKEENISMCGVAPVSILIHCCKLLKANKAGVILYQTSADVNKDSSSVVGYAGVILH